MSLAHRKYCTEVAQYVEHQYLKFNCQILEKYYAIVRTGLNAFLSSNEQKEAFRSLC